MKTPSAITVPLPIWMLRQRSIATRSRDVQIDHDVTFIASRQMWSLILINLSLLHRQQALSYTAATPIAV
jgi:hypothetical protein